MANRDLIENMRLELLDNQIRLELKVETLDEEQRKPIYNRITRLKDIIKFISFFLTLSK